MEQTTVSAHFPKKIDKMTRKVAKLISEKYKLEESSPNSPLASLPKDQEHLLEELRLHHHEQVNAAFEKSEKMNKKLKLIRTMLGYEYQSSQKRQRIKEQEREVEKPLDEKGLNLKQFVMSMRKRNELTDKYFKPRKVSTIEENVVVFDPESKNIQEYTDASLKYVHSFLPHHTTFEHSEIRRKKSNQNLTLTPQYHKQGSPISRNSKYVETLQNPQSSTNRLQPVASSQKKPTIVFKNKRSLTIGNPSLHLSRNRRSITYVTDIRKEEHSPMASVQKKQTINLPAVCMESPTNQKQFRTISSTAPLDVYAARVTQLIYRGKNYNKQLKNHVRIHREQDRLPPSPNRQPKSPLNQLLPTIKPCIPQVRTKAGNGGNSGHG